VRVAVVVLVVQGGHGTHAAGGLAVAHRVAAPAAAAEPDAGEDGEGAHGRAHGDAGNSALGKGRRAGARGRRDRHRGRRHVARGRAGRGRVLAGHEDLEVDLVKAVDG
jgi:hypothetical protein